MFSSKLPQPSARAPLRVWHLVLSYFEAVNLSLKMGVELEYDFLLLAADLADHGAEDLLLRCIDEGAYDPEDVLVLPDFVSPTGMPSVDARAAKDVARILIAKHAAEAIAAEIVGAELRGIPATACTPQDLK